MDESHLIEYVNSVYVLYQGFNQMGGQNPVVSFNLIIAKVPESKFDPVIMS